MRPYFTLPYFYLYRTPNGPHGGAHGPRGPREEIGKHCVEHPAVNPNNNPQNTFVPNTFKSGRAIKANVAPKKTTKPFGFREL